MNNRRWPGFFAMSVAAALGCDGEIRLAGDPDGGPDAAPVVDGANGMSEASSTDAVAATGACATDRDCFHANLHCDETTRTCVPCLEDSHCPSKDMRRCDTASHRCVACGVSADCEEEKGCEAITHKCVPLCAAGGDACPSEAPTCDLKRGICIGCTVDGSCKGDKPICESGSGTCVECRTAANCTKEKPRCDLVRGKCVQCNAPSDCPSEKPFCDPSDGECFKP